MKLIALLLAGQLGTGTLGAEKAEKWINLPPYPGKVAVKTLGDLPKLKLIKSVITRDPVDLQQIAYSPDGRRYAVATEEDGWHLHVDGGTVEGRFDEIWRGAIWFSPDSKRIAYLARLGDQWMAVVDNKPEKKYDMVGPVVFSPDSRSYLYAASKGRKWEVVKDAVTIAEVEDIYEAPQFGPGTGEVYYVARKAQTETLFINGEAKVSYPSIRTVVVHSSGETLLVTSETPRPPSKRMKGHTNPFSGRYFESFAPGKLQVRYGSFTSPLYDHVGSIALAPVGTNFALIARVKGEEFVVLNGADQKHYGSGSNKGIFEAPVFSPDGKRLAYAAASGSGKHFVVVDGVEGEAHKSIGDGTLVFSPDSKRFAYMAQKGLQVFWVLDGQGGPQFPAGFVGREVPGVFSPDSKRFVTLQPFTVEQKGYKLDLWHATPPIFLQNDRVAITGVSFASQVRASVQRVEFELP
jgi:hypothetical protein